MLADAVAYVAAKPVLRCEIDRALGQGVVGAGQVRRAAEQFGARLEHRVDRCARGSAGREAWLGLGHSLRMRAQRGDGRILVASAQGGGEGVALGGLFQPPRPFLAGTCAARAKLFPGRAKFAGNFKRRVHPAERGLRARHLLVAQRLAMRLGGARALGRAVADDCLAGDQHRLVGFGGGFKGARGVSEIVAVASQHIPAAGREARFLVGDVRQRHGAIDGDRIVVPYHDQLVQFVPARERDRFLAYPLHQAAIADDDPSAVIDQFIAEARIQMRLRHRHADSVGEPLAKRTGGGFNALRVSRIRDGLASWSPIDGSA